MTSTLLTDPQLPTLAGVFDPATLGAQLVAAVPGLEMRVEDIRFQILKHHPGSRCTFEIACRTAAGDPVHLIGKVYATDRPDVFRAMEAIQRSGFGPENEYSIPRPLAYLPELRLLLQEKVEGPRAKLIILEGGEADRAGAATRAAAWLARFHTLAPRPRSGLAEQLEIVHRWSLRIARLGEPFASRARQLAHRLAETAAAAAPAHVCAGHGSYSCHQIILAGRRTVTYDWDSYDLADPARDVARFVVGLQRLALKYLGRLEALDAVADVFVSTYRVRSPYDVRENLGWYRALTCLRLAKYEANRPVCTFADGIASLLEEGLRVVSEKSGEPEPCSRQNEGPSLGDDRVPEQRI